jgi:hypothetical protein
MLMAGLCRFANELLLRLGQPCSVWRGLSGAHSSALLHGSMVAGAAPRLCSTGRGKALRAVAPLEWRVAHLFASC